MGKVILLLASLVFIIVVPERIFRVLVTSERGAYNDYGTRFDFVLSPYLMFAEPDVRQGGSLNYQGFQGPELSREHGANEVRIAVLGGSAAYNGGATNSIAGHLEKILNGRYPDKNIRVVNFGRPSYISMQELILLQRNVLALSPDLIIIYDGFNDIWVPYSALEPVGFPFLYSNLKSRVERNRFFNFDVMLKYIASKSALFNYLLTAREKAPTRQKALNIDELTVEYKRNLNQMCVLARANKSGIILSTQPHIGSKNIKSAKEISIEKSYLNETDVKNMQAFFEKMAGTAREVADQNGSYYVNVLDVFENLGEDIFIDLVHVKVEIGNPIIAKRLADEIVRREILFER